MRTLIRSMVAVVLAGGLLSGWSTLPLSGVGAADHLVTMFDTPSPPYRPIDAETGTWGYGPAHIDVVKGEKITFVNPTTNTQPHTVTSLKFSNTPTLTVEAGTFFDSSPGGRESRMAIGTSFVVDTSTLDAAQYTYYCSAHPWMVGTFTVTAPAGS